MTRPSDGHIVLYAGFCTFGLAFLLQNALRLANMEGPRALATILALVCVGVILGVAGSFTIMNEGEETTDG